MRDASFVCSALGFFAMPIVRELGFIDGRPVWRTGELGCATRKVCGSAVHVDNCGQFASLYCLCLVVRGQEASAACVGNASFVSDVSALLAMPIVREL